MGVVVRRIFSIVVLGLCVLGAGANVAQAAARLDHSCCHRSASGDSLTPPEAPCGGFLPLTCCHAAALPGGDHASLPTPAAVAVVTAAAIVATPATAIARPDDAALAPAIAAKRLLVVRQL